MQPHVTFIITFLLHGEVQYRLHKRKRIATVRNEIKRLKFMSPNLLEKRRSILMKFECSKILWIFHIYRKNQFFTNQHFFSFSSIVPNVPEHKWSRMNCVFHVIAFGNEKYKCIWRFIGNRSYWFQRMALQGQWIKPTICKIPEKHLFTW